MIATSRAPVRLFWNDHNRWEWLGRVALVGLAAGAVLAIAGLPPVDVHGPLHHVGIMDPLCGGTRGLRLMMRGHLASAWRDNPLAVFLPPAAVAALAREGRGWPACPSWPAPWRTARGRPSHPRRPAPRLPA